MIKQFVKFGIVGLSNTLVYLLIFNSLLSFTGEDIAYFAGFIISVINAYFWSSRFVFAKQEPTDGLCSSKGLTTAAKQEPTDGLCSSKDLTTAAKQEPTDGRKSTAAKRLVKLYIAYGLTTLLGYALMKLLINSFEISARISSFLILFLTIPLNFILNKLWVFRVP
ncbi:MAG: GtrA family protein [Oscillospiraceae bacterium]|nr:GtrA family protein [Oscillospiraceae bacterium]